jgi:hypothetical protein
MNEYKVQTPQHDWNYLLALDDDIGRLARFLEPTKDNFASYSLELARILIVAASEVDVVSKGLCKKLDKNSKADNIEQYREAILSAHPKIKGAVVEMPRFGLTLNPWGQWERDVSPVWWTAYNKVKHHRNTHFFQANLENALNAIAGLFILLLFFYGNEAKNGDLNPAPVHFRAGAPFFVTGLFLSDYPTMVYLLERPKE